MLNDAVSLGEIPLITRLKAAKNVLIAGAGGGFDVYSGIPLYLSLKAAGKNVFLANLSFAVLSITDSEWLQDCLWKVEPGQKRPGVLPYFPEKHLCNWFRSRGEDVAIYAFEKTGVLPLHRSYQYLVKLHDIDTVILVDGGTDSLMSGDEAGLGTPGEDSCSMVAVSQLEGVDKLLVCLGFGVDHYHGVCHYHFLENVATLSKLNAYLGSFALLSQMPESQAYLDAIRYVNEKMPSHSSIVCNSIASALEGHYGNHHATTRTTGSDLWVNPLMSMYWSFELDVVVQHLMYSKFIEDTSNFNDLLERIVMFRQGMKTRPWTDLPI